MSNPLRKFIYFQFASESDVNQMFVNAKSIAHVKSIHVSEELVKELQFAHLWVNYLKIYVIFVLDVYRISSIARIFNEGFQYFEKLNTWTNRRRFDTYYIRIKNNFNHIWIVNFQPKGVGMSPPGRMTAPPLFRTKMTISKDAITIYTQMN